MGNSITTFSNTTDNGGAMLEPLVEDEQVRNERARIAEAFHYSRKDQEGQLEMDNSQNNTTTYNPAEDGESVLLEEKKLQTEEQFDPFKNLKQAEGWTPYVHIVTSDDTLAGLSLRYNVSTDEIRRANFMTNDRLTSFRTIIVPKQSANSPANKNATVPANPQDIEKANRLRKHRLVDLLQQMDDDKLSRAAAVYYLDQNGYNLKQAMDELDADTEWEKLHMESGLATLSNRHSFDDLKDCD